MGIIQGLDTSTIGVVVQPYNFSFISLPQEERPISILEELLYNLEWLWVEQGQSKPLT